MILEGIVTTRSANGEIHIAPMGPRVEKTNFDRFLLRPYQTSTTYQNLARDRQGVLHVSDDVSLFVDGALRDFETLPPHRDSETVDGFVLTEACRFFEFRVLSIDESSERTEMDCQVVQSGELRPFWGFNRARHAVLEAAILATRVHLLDPAEIRRELERLKIVVDKTAGETEHLAFEKIVRYLDASWQADQS